MKNELIVPNVAEVIIPSTKLNTVQQKQYREYGFKVLAQIEGQIGEIQAKEMDDFRKENKEKIVEKILGQNPKIAQTVMELNERRSEIEELQKKRTKDIDETDKLIKELENRRNKVIADYNEKISSAFSSFEDLKEKLVESDMEGVDSLALSGMELKYKNHGDDDLNTVWNAEIKIEAKDVLDNDYIEGELSENYRNKEKEVARIKQAVQEMRETLEEVMLFDESKLKPLFEKILDTKQKVKAKYNTIFLS
ncbi:MAG: hypothetical protein ACYC54_15595 [Sedimentisphaerales bacterium]